MNDSLTSRELEVLKLACKGLTYMEIANILHVSYRTVNGHLSHVYDKLNAKSIVQAFRIALLDGIITLEDLKKV